MYNLLLFQYEMPIKTLKSVETRVIFFFIGVSVFDIMRYMYMTRGSSKFQELVPNPFVFEYWNMFKLKKKIPSLWERTFLTTQARYHLDLTFYDFKVIHCGIFNELLDSVLSTLSYWSLSSFLRFFFILKLL